MRHDGHKRGAWLLFRTPLSLEDFIGVMCPKFSEIECVDRLSDRFSPTQIRQVYRTAAEEHRGRNNARLARLIAAFPSKGLQRFDCSPAAIAAAFVWLEGAGLR